MLGHQKRRHLLTAMKSQRGFNLIEVIVSMALMAVLMGLAVPFLSSSTQNARIRSTADSLAAGLQTARTEAIRRNSAVEFIFIKKEVEAVAANRNTTELSANGINWMVRTKDPADPTSAEYLFIDGKSASEGSGRTDGSTSIVMVPATTDGTGFNRITFNSLGSVAFNDTAGSAGRIDVSNPTGGACSTASEPTAMRCLRVQISVSGQVRVCDPLVTDTADPRRCS